MIKLPMTNEKKRCKFPNLCRHLFPENTFDSDLCLSCCLLKSFRTWWLVVGPPTAFPRTGPMYRGSLPGPTVVSQSPGWLCGKAPTLCVLVGALMLCDSRVRGRGRVSRTGATENTYNRRNWYLHFLRSHQLSLLPDCFIDYSLHTLTLV